MKILFHDNQLSYRGTSNAMFDYALYSREILGHEPVITYQKNNDNNFAPAIKRFCNNFEVIPYQNTQELKNIIKNEQIDLFYKITGGEKENLAIDIKTAIHAVFKHYEPYGDVYAYVSKWLSLEMSQGQLPFVPHIIHLPDHQADLRAELGIPKDAIVFGQYGGAESFDIKFVKKTIKYLSRKRKDLFFLFMGTNPFAKANLFFKYKNIIFLPTNVDIMHKVAFINTCDAFIHARHRGETFGIAIGEFSSKNKPIITFRDSEEKNHLQVLKDKALLYSNGHELTNILMSFNPDIMKQKDWDCYSQAYSPANVMTQFNQVFIEN